MTDLKMGAAAAVSVLGLLLGAGCSGTDGDTNTGSGGAGAGSAQAGTGGAATGGTGGSGAGSSGSGGSAAGSGGGGTGAGGSGGTGATGGTGGSGGAGLDPTGTFSVRILEVESQEQDANGDAWDALGGLPDLYVCGGFGNEAGCTGFCDDRTSCTYQDGTLTKADGSRLLLKGSELASGLVLEVWDDDISDDDFVGGTTMSITTLATEYATGPFGQVVQVRFELY